MATEETRILFAGPTLSARARQLAKPFRLRPPVKRDDVKKLIEAHAQAKRAPGLLVIVDGVFHDTLAVGHAEIRTAIGRGWRVWGGSSMGAIRAREMAALGMRGFGRVFEQFMMEGDFQDDEVALLHEASPPYRAVTEPLVHLRAAVDHLVARGMVADHDAKEVIADLKSRWYGDRTVRAMIELLAPRVEGGAAAVRKELGDFRRFSLKTLDLEAFLDGRTWVRQAPAKRARRKASR